MLITIYKKRKEFYMKYNQLFVCLFFLPLCSQYYVAHKYGRAFVNQTVEKYISLCRFIEEKHICKPQFLQVRLLIFTNPCIIGCYNSMLKKHSVKPLCDLWDAYKADTVECEKNKFLYELCHLIFIIFEQVILQIFSSDSNPDKPSSLQELFEKVEATLPIDDLIEVLEQCYNKIKEIVDKVELHQGDASIRIQKRWLMLIISTVVVAKKIYEYWMNKKPIVHPVNA